jgi:hypothetical protein
MMMWNRLTPVAAAGNPVEDATVNVPDVVRGELIAAPNDVVSRVLGDAASANSVSAAIG